MRPNFDAEARDIHKMIATMPEARAIEMLAIMLKIAHHQGTTYGLDQASEALRSAFTGAMEPRP